MVSSTREVSAVNLKKMLRISIKLGLFIAFSSAAVWAKNLPQESPSVTISVFNDSGISSEILKEAEKVSSQVFEESGIHVDWVTCFPAEEAPGGEVACRQAAFPQHLHLRIVRRSLSLKDSTLGISYLLSDGTGCQADIFYEGIEKLRHETFVDPAIILGHVAAHEIGHLLLGNNSHSPWGIMRAQITVAPDDREALRGCRWREMAFSERHRTLSSGVESPLVQPCLIAPRPSSRE